MDSLSSSQPSTHPPHSWETQALRREYDTIAAIEARIRQVLLGTSAQYNEKSHFSDLITIAVTSLAIGMSEILIEVWLVGMSPWGRDDIAPRLQLMESIAPHVATLTVTSDRSPADVLLAVVTAGRPLRFDDAVSHPLVRAWAKDASVDPNTIQSFLGVPLVCQGQLLGVIAVAIPTIPTVEHANLIDAVADYLAICSLQTHISHQLQSQQATAQAVVQDAPVATAVLSPDNYVIVFTNKLFDRLLQIGPDVWGSQLGTVLPEHAELLRHSLHLDEVVQTGQMRTILDLPIQLASGLTYWDFTCTPMFASDHIIEGVLLAGVDVTSRVQQRQRQRRAVNIAQARVYQMVSLHQISIEVASQYGQNPDTLLLQIVERMAQLMNAPGGMVFFVDRETGQLEVVLTVGLHKDYTGIRLDRGQDLAGRVVITGEGQWVDDYRIYPLRASIFANEPFGEVAAIPMRQRGRVIGVISLIRYPLAAGVHSLATDDEEIPPNFTDEDIWLLDLFAGQAALAIENAHTYTELEHAYQQQRTLDRQKDDFIARVSHDLRLPLTSVMGFLDLLLESWEMQSTEDNIAMLQTAFDEAGQLAEMLDQLLSQARLDSGKRPLNMTAIRLMPVIEEIRRSRQKQISLQSAPFTFTFAIDSNLWVMADLSRLKEVLENLISNAMKYSPNGGQIRCDAQIIEGDGIPNVLVHVSDQGIGIIESGREHLFERFSRIDSPLVGEVRGSGLGLYLTRQLLESMDGRIWLQESTPGQGSVFCFTLPLAEPQ